MENKKEIFYGMEKFPISEDVTLVKIEDKYALIRKDGKETGLRFDEVTLLPNGFFKVRIATTVGLLTPNLDEHGGLIFTEITFDDEKYGKDVALGKYTVKTDSIVYTKLCKLYPDGKLEELSETVV